MLVVLDAIHTSFFRQDDLSQHAEISNAINKLPPEFDVLYIGESSNVTFKGSDCDKRSIADLLAANLPGLSVYQITQPAAHAGTYRTILNYLVQHKKPRLVVLTVNLRSFSAEWKHSKLEGSLQESLVLLRNYPALVNRFLLVFGGYHQPSSKENDQKIKQAYKQPIPSFANKTNYQTTKEWIHWYRKTNRPETVLSLGEKYIKAYGFEIDVLRDQRISDINAIIELLHLQGIRVVLNIVPENFEKAQSLVGSELCNLMRKNVQTILLCYSNKGITCIDNSELLTDERFIDKEWTTEHYDEIGRHSIAARVATEIAEIYNSPFVPVHLDEQRYLQTFFNDCEGGNNWVGLHTISSEKAYSGLYASKIDKHEPYSVTFEYPIQFLPADKKHRVSISFYLSGTPNESSGVILQTTGNDPYVALQHFDIAQTDPKQWRFQRFTFQLSDTILQGETLKLFVTTDGETPLFVDDIRVEFE